RCNARAAGHGRGQDGFVDRRPALRSGMRSTSRTSGMAAVLLLLVACEAPADRSETVPLRAAAELAPPVRGLDSVLLGRAFERAAALPRLHSMLVARHGERVREEYFRGPGRDRPANLKSASK